MIVRKYVQVVEIGNHGDGWYDELVVKETVKNAILVNQFREETDKEDVEFWRGIYHSPRVGAFRITYKFVEESEESE